MKLFPVICGSAFKNKGVQPMLDAVVDYLPSPLDIPATMANDPQPERRAGGAPGQGRRAVLGARLQDHDRPVRRPARVPPRLLGQPQERRHRPQHHARASKERIGRLLKMHANKREEIKDVYAGDIAAAVGLKNVTTGDTICDPANAVVLESIDFPAPVIALAVEPKTKSDQEKLGAGLAKLMQEDPTFKVETDTRHRPDQDLRHGRAAPRDHRRPPEARVQRRGQRRQAAGRLQGDDPQERPRARASTSSRPAARASTATARSSWSRRRARASSSRTTSRAAPSPRSSSSRSSRASARRWTAASSPATRWWT